MTKILFVMPYSLDHQKGHLSKKYDGQIEASEKLGLETWFTAFDKGNVYLCNRKEKIFIGKSVISTKNIIQSHFIFCNIQKIFSHQKFDMCYIRTVPPIPSYMSALKTIKANNCKIVVEIPTYRKNATDNENKNRKFHSFIINALDLLFGSQIPQYVDLYTLIGDSSNSYKGVDAVNIQNGINTNQTPLKKLNNHSDNELHMLAVAKVSYWHGFDRVIHGLRNYYTIDRPVKVFFHIVGDAGDNSIQLWKSLVKKFELGNFVFFEGFKTGSELNEAFNQAEIAIGSLGLYRENLQNASSIKITEYCARGIPFIYAGNNELLNSNEPFWLEVPNNESPIEIEEIVNFYKTVWKIDDLPNKMRIYSDINMSWERQLRIVLKSLYQKFPGNKDLVYETAKITVSED